MQLGIPVTESPKLEIQGSYNGQGIVNINGHEVSRVNGHRNGVVLFEWNDITYLDSPLVTIEVICTSGYITVQGVSIWFGVDVNHNLPSETKLNLYQSKQPFEDGYLAFPVVPKGWVAGGNVTQHETVDNIPVEQKPFHTFNAGSIYKCKLDAFRYSDPLEYIINYKPGAEFFESTIPYK